MPTDLSQAWPSLPEPGGVASMDGRRASPPRGDPSPQAPRSTHPGRGADPFATSPAPALDCDRMLDLFTQVVSELGCSERSLALILSSSGLSRSDFEERFSGLDGCFLEVIDRALGLHGPLIAHSYTSAERRYDAIGAALESLLELLDAERPLVRLLFVQALSAGPQVKARRQHLLDQLAGVIAGDAFASCGSHAPSPLVGEAIVGAVFTVIRSRLLPAKRSKLIELHGPLMSGVVSPGLGLPRLPTPVRAADATDAHRSAAETICVEPGGMPRSECGRQPSGGVVRVRAIASAGQSVRSPPAAREENAEDLVRWARSPERDDAFWYLQLPTLIELLPPPGESTLDVGCGEGRAARALKKLGHHMVGLESSSVRAWAARSGDPAFEVHVADAAAMPFADDLFDLAIASLSLMNRDDMPSVVGEIARVLRPGGRFCFSILHPINPWGDAAAGYFETVRYTEKLERDCAPMIPHDTHRSLGDYFGALGDAGFLVERLIEPIPDAGRRLTRPGFLHVRAVLGCIAG